jgi:hypothetical protein
MRGILLAKGPGTGELTCGAYFLLRVQLQESLICRAYFLLRVQDAGLADVYKFSRWLTGRCFFIFSRIFC